MSDSKKRTQGAPIVGSKRTARTKDDSDQPVNDENNNQDEMMVAEDGIEFEDPYGDEYEEESVEEVDGSDEEAEADIAMDETATATEPVPKKEVWRAGIDKLDEGEELEYDPAAYQCYHSLRTEWPCLSFDILQDTLGSTRLRFPHTMFLATGSQADRADRNIVTLLKLSDIHKTYHNDNDDSDDEDNDEDDDQLDEDPVLEHINLKHHGGVNRLRCMPGEGNSGVIATLSDAQTLTLLDTRPLVQSLMTGMPRNPATVSVAEKPIASFILRDEGYGLAWSAVNSGKVAAGDCSGDISVFGLGPSGAEPLGVYKGHNASVEDIEWSGSEGTVFTSCSSDRTLRVWDIRDKQKKAQLTMSDVHPADVNVLSWNHKVGYLLASGGDEGCFKVWDLRKVKSGNANTPLAHFSFHSGHAITSIEWHGSDESMLGVASEDDSVSVWDLSVEADDSNAQTPYPPQLLFLHLGQKEIKELHFHKQIPGMMVSTASDSFNVFKPAITVANT